MHEKKYSNPKARQHSNLLNFPLIPMNARVNSQELTLIQQKYLKIDNSNLLSTPTVN